MKPYRYRFSLPPLKSPTYYNLYQCLEKQGFRYTRYPCRAHFTEKNFDFDQPTAETLEFKHLLAQLVAHYCPEVMPETYCINDHNWTAQLNLIAEKYYITNNQLVDSVKEVAWILKPSLLNNGQHIKLFQTLSEIEQHFMSSNRLGGEHVLQRYLSPHLLRGHKYSIRMFVILSNYAEAFLYPYGYFNVALQPYLSNEFTTINAHLTNEHLDSTGSNVVQIPSQKFDFFPALYPQIKTIVNTIITSLRHQRPQTFKANKQRTLAIFGFDFMVDDRQQVWLLEANHGPCFPTSDNHPLQKILYADFWQTVITNFVLPLCNETKNQT